MHVDVMSPYLTWALGRRTSCHGLGPALYALIPCSMIQQVRQILPSSDCGIIMAGIEVSLSLRTIL